MDKFALLFSLSPVGPKTFQKLVKTYGSAKAAWEESDNIRFKEAGIGNIVFQKFQEFKSNFDVDDYLEKLQRAKVEYVSFFDKNFPVSLKKLENPPIVLFTRGNTSLLGKNNNLGVVGTRKITSYGAQVTDGIVAEIASFGLTIISGMAMGVDAAAHRAAIKARGATIAVLGCGVDCPYPRENEKLYRDILNSNGLIISEYPLGMQANKGTFPARNRIIAALSCGILVTEAGENSGSLITAANAIHQNKPVFAVPGPITSQVSKGSFRLLKEGAVMVSSAEEILLELEIKSQKQKSNVRHQAYDGLGKKEKKIIKAIENESKTIDQIAKETKYDVSKLAIILSEMEILGYIKNTFGKYIIN